MVYLGVGAGVRGARSRKLNVQAAIVAAGGAVQATRGVGFGVLPCLQRENEESCCIRNRDCPRKAFGIEKILKRSPLAPFPPLGNR